MGEELKAGPLCGHIGVTVHEGSTFRWLVAECDSCGAQNGEIRVQTIGPGTPQEWAAAGKKDALTAWNARAPQPTKEGGG